jgi:Tfp pilus assembly protein PilX
MRPNKQMSAPLARAGFALPLVLFALVIVGTVITGVFYTANMESAIGRNEALQERAFEAAEYGLHATIEKWGTLATSTTNNAVGSYKPASSGCSSPTTCVGYSTLVPKDSASLWKDTVRITKLSSTRYQMVSTATINGGILRYARHRTAMDVKLMYPTFNFQAALMTQGNIQIGGSSYINGYDQSPTGWGCSNALVNKPGIVIDSRSNVGLAGCTALRCVDGTPDIRNSTAASDTMNYFVFGDLKWADVTAMATWTFTGGTFTGIAPALTGSACDTSLNTNWGDPRRLTPAGACESYFPIIYMNGSGRMSNGTGQGILLVQGDLEISGNFEWSGPIIVRGTFTTTGTGNKVTGGVMADNANLSSSAVLGNAVVNYSTCVLNTAALAAAVPKPIIQRAWTDMFTGG